MLKFQYMVCQIAIGLSLSTIALTEAKTLPPADMDIYLLMGQSNMSGRGDLAELPESLRASDIVWLYGNDGVWRPAQEPLDDPTNEVDAVSSDAGKAGVGPGLSFGQAMAGGSRPIALVPCAKGGSSLSQWTPDTSRTRLYGSCLARAREASAKGRIAGVLWYQGETDAGQMATAQVWGERMTTLIARMRQDIGNACLPWVIVGLSDRPDPLRWPKPTDGWAQVQAAQIEVASSIANVGFVSAAGLPKNADGIHLSTAAQLQLGPKLAAAMKLLRRQSC
ncbi:sialate O-acetylesterase [Asticcacaulis machinosus]|uniref:Sialate O-acetylesterase n=1 Tax=Asticcacaulis machinosus TaxID=2984211 RepID=A0ABT5HPD4_9CAUL|nr:sialate O-acetylesterase [Asticcacaulis machinosus]MDC7677499.1 sialate O-acetylesterase [Asticcacaulis machinosus]